MNSLAMGVRSILISFFGTSWRMFFLASFALLFAMHAQANSDSSEHFEDNMWVLSATSLQYSVVSSAGFITAVLVVWIGIALDSSPGRRMTGNFGKFMIMVEALDAFPEAAILAIATTNHTMTWAFVISIFMLNVSNTFATSIDIIATKTKKILHQVLFISLSMSVGMLSYTIPTQVYATFNLHWKDGEKNGLHIALLFVGTAFGAILIVALMNLEAKIHGKAHDTQRDKFHTLREHVGQLQKIYEDFEEEGDTEGEISSLTSTRLDTYFKERNTKNEQRKQHLAHMLSLIESLEGLEEYGETTAIVGDTTEILHEIVLEDSVPLMQSPASLHWRAFKLLMTMLVIATWAAILTWSLCLLFYFLSDAPKHALGYVDTFAEGLSGGAFLATVAGTMLPRLQQDAYRTGWAKENTRIFGLVAFEAGLMFAVVIDILQGKSLW